MKISIKKLLKELNSYGELNGIPSGWITTFATIPQLKKNKVPFFKSLIGWDTRYKNYPRPIKSNIIRKSDAKKINEYLTQPKKQSKPQKTAIQKYAEWISDDVNTQQDIIESYDNNKNTRGTAWKLLSQAYNEDNMDLAESALEMMNVSRARHEETDYDLIDKRGTSEEDVDRLRRIYNQNLI